MLAAGEATMRRACARVDAEGEEFLRSLEQDGVTLVRPSQQDQAQLKAIAQEVRSDWVSELEHRGKPAAGVLSSFEAAIGAAQPGSRAGAPR